MLKNYWLKLQARKTQKLNTIDTKYGVKISMKDYVDISKRN